MADFPFDKAAKAADVLIKRGNIVYQKWTCDGCGARCTVNTSNYFTKLCVCEHCGHITDVKAKGCGFLTLYTGE